MSLPDTPQESVDIDRSDIPPEVAAIVARCGRRAAERLFELLDGKGWQALKASDKARLIELGLTRAYGPPIKREQTLTLSGRVSDAVADSLARLSAADLPETRDHATRHDPAPLDPEPATSPQRPQNSRRRRQL